MDVARFSQRVEPKHVGPRRLGRTRGKMRLRRWPHDGRSGLASPDAGAQSVGPMGDSWAGGESAPPRVGTPAAHFSN